MTCTFFGHRETPDHLDKRLFSVLQDLIQNHGVDHFYVGNQGNFDSIARRALKKLKSIYPWIRFEVVLAYLPQKKDEVETGVNTRYPEGLENVLKKLAIVYRNRFMLQQADVVVTYVTHTVGGAAKFQELAYKQGKIVINLAQT